MHESIIQSIERRKYFRIEDEIGLIFQLLSTNEIEEEKTLIERNNATFSLISELHNIDSTMMTHLNKIKERSRDLAEYLTALNDKVHLIAKMVVASTGDIPTNPTHKVNISAGGVAFPNPTAIEIGALMYLQIILYPSFLGVTTKAKVINCQPEPDNDQNSAFSIAAEFLNIKESDREALIKVILQKQSEQLRIARQAKYDIVTPQQSDN